MSNSPRSVTEKSHIYNLVSSKSRAQLIFNVLKKYFYTSSMSEMGRFVNPVRVIATIMDWQVIRFILLEFELLIKIE